jgi:hypothetical protein
VLAVVVAWSLLGPVIGTAHAAGTHQAKPVSQEQAEAAAIKRAQASDAPVEVMADRTETRQVMAQPDGTLVSDESLDPRWVKGSDGSWQAVDPTLTATADGHVAPKRVPVSVTLSGGGSAPLVQSTDAGHSMAMAWPGTLPKPSLSGDTATYAVRPGIDLKVSVSPQGVSQQVVIKDRTAAADPALAKLTFGLSGNSIAMRKTTGGGIELGAAGGAAVAHLPPARMWDSAEADNEANEKVLPLEPGPATIAITPDQTMLSDAATQFPVVLASSDPTPEWSGSKQAWGLVDRAFPSTAYYNSDHRPEVGNYGSGIKRSFFRMDSNNVNGKHILQATFRILQNYSWGCTSTPSATEIYLAGSLHTSTTWNNQPAWRDLLDSVAKDAGYGSSCPDDDDEFDVTSAVVTAAKSGWPNTTFGLKDRDDTNSSTWGWKGFSASPHLVIKYNTPPQTPYGMATSPGGTACVQGTGRPLINPSSALSGNLELSTQLKDPDKDIKSGDPDDQVRAEFEVNHFNTATQAWEPVGSRINGGYIPSGSAQSTKVTVPATSFTNGEVYRWHVWAYDGTDHSGWSPWCEFGVDATPPDQAPQVTSTDYPDDQPTDPAGWHGGVGRTGTFTFAAGAGETDVAGFQYELDSTDVDGLSPTVNASTPVQVTPKHEWLNTLYVFPVDQAGNVGTHPAAYSFDVQPASLSGGPVGHWALDEGSGTTAADTSAGGHAVTWTGGVTWGSGRIDKSSHLNGTTGYGTTSGPIVHTDKSFTVAAWVRLTDNTHNTTVMAQAGNVNSGFQLYYSKTYDRWIFNKHVDDTSTTDIARASSDQPPTLNAWTHLVGVYDGGALGGTKQIRLYVNGIVQSTAPTLASVWDATGPLEVGRVKYNSGFQDYFAGDIDDVNIWDRAVSDLPDTSGWAPEIHDLATQPPSNQGLWSLDEGAGTSAADSSPGGHPITLSGPAVWDPEGQIGADVTFDGTSVYGATTGPVLRTDNSFTVAAWVRMRSDDHTGTVLSQAGSRDSGFQLYYSALYKKWIFNRHLTDTDNPAFARAMSTDTDPPELDSWTHLAGVFDLTDHTIRLYVNGSFNSEVDCGAAWNATGPFEIGRVKYNGGFQDYFEGDIDDVHVYAGALTRDQVSELQSSGIPPTTG